MLSTRFDRRHPHSPALAVFCPLETQARLALEAATALLGGHSDGLERRADLGIVATRFIQQQPEDTAITVVTVEEQLPELSDIPVNDRRRIQP